jgi:hypothetical protein
MDQLDRRSYTMAPTPHAAVCARGRARRIALTIAAATCAGAVQAALTVEVLRPIEALPPHVAGIFRDPTGFEQLASGEYLVFDRGGHTVYRVDAARTQATEVVRIGQEDGRLLQPVAFDAGPDGSFAVADAPYGRERVQVFSADGSRLSGFALPGRSELRVTFGGVVLNGIGSLSYDGTRVYVNQPEGGALITSYSILGRAERSIGRLRPTPAEASDRDVHIALNTGLPIADPRGGFYFVFQTGEPRFRKYDASGALVFERVIQGTEIDTLLASQPTSWPARGKVGRELPVVPPVVRTASVDPSGRLWISFVVPWTYVYDTDGDKIRTVQFTTTGKFAPSSLSFGVAGRLLVTPGCYVFSWPDR